MCSSTEKFSFKRNCDHGIKVVKLIMQNDFLLIKNFNSIIQNLKFAPRSMPLFIFLNWRVNFLNLHRLENNDSDKDI